LRYGRLAPVGAARRGAAPLVVASSSSRCRCAVLATQPSRQLHAALVTQSRRERRAARTASPLPYWPASRRRLHVVGCMPVLVTSSLRPLRAARCADRADSPSARPPVVATLRVPPC